MIVPFFKLDAFTDALFGGNPAAVCLLDYWPEARLLQNIAAENNLPETAFLVGMGDEYDLRWFTPSVEIDLCGHATLASAHVLFNEVDTSIDRVVFTTRSGELTVEKCDGGLAMAFPARPPAPCDMPDMLARALGAKPVETLMSRDLVAVFEHESDIHGLRPDFELMKTVPGAFGIIATAPGDEADFVSRFFAPNAGIPEDPVTGSAHCTLAPFWAGRLGKTRMMARQLSSRGGGMICWLSGDRVVMEGTAVMFARGEIIL